VRNVCKMIAILTFAICHTSLIAKGGTNESKPAASITQERRAFRLSDQAGEFKIEADKAGNLTCNGEKIGKIGAQGFFFKMDGEKVAQLKDDGDFTNSKGRLLAKVLPNGDVKGPLMTFSWKKNQLEFGKNHIISLAEGTDETRQLASCAMILILSLEEQVALAVE
jgi:hypothetical protein